MLHFFTADEAKRRFGVLLKRAEDFPAFITRHGRLRYVVMSAQVFEALLIIARAHEENKIAVAANSAIARFAKQDVKGGVALVSEAHGQMRRIDRFSVR